MDVVPAQNGYRVLTKVGGRIYLRRALAARWQDRSCKEPPLGPWPPPSVLSAEYRQLVVRLHGVLHRLFRAVGPPRTGTLSPPGIPPGAPTRATHGPSARPRSRSCSRRRRGGGRGRPAPCRS